MTNYFHEFFFKCIKIKVKILEIFRFLCYKRKKTPIQKSFYEKKWKGNFSFLRSEFCTNILWETRFSCVFEFNCKAYYGNFVSITRRHVFVYVYVCIYECPSVHSYAIYNSRPLKLELRQHRMISSSIFHLPWSPMININSHSKIAKDLHVFLLIWLKICLNHII